MDEQANFDPLCPNNTFPSTLWGVDFTDDGMERASIDLQDYYYIDAISIHDAPAIGELTIQIADSPNGPWTTIEEYQTIGLNQWVTFTNSIPANKPIRYLRLIASADDRALIGELFLCGRLSNFTTDIAPGKAKNVLVEGINCFSADLKWDHPFDKDISHYKVITGNDVQLFPYTATNQAVTISNLQPDTTYSFNIVTVDSIGQESDTLKINASTLPEGACNLVCNPSCPCQICLNPSWISYETPGNTIPVSYLVDEQNTVSFCGAGGTPTTGWGYDFGNTLPVAILDLQQIYQIESFRFFDSNGMDDFRVEYKDEQGDWVLLFDDFSTMFFNSWIIMDELNIAARFLRISELDNGARVNEIAICGYPLCMGTETTEIFDTLCQGQSVLFNDQILTTSGVYFDTLQTANSCDSFVVLNLTVFDVVHTAIEGAICPGGSYYFNEQNLTTAGVYLDTLATSNACDSFITLTLSLFNTANTAISHTICPGGSYYFNEQNLTTAGVYLDTLATSNACDSFITLTLSLFNTANTAISHTICPGGSYYFNEQNLTTAGVYLDTLATSNACDSFITLTLSLFNTANTAISHTICQGDSYYFNGQNLTTAGVYLDTLATSNACDSFIVFTLEVLQEGDSCDDGNPNTSNDTLDENCTCIGEGLDPNSCNVTVTLSGDTIKIENMIQPITKVDIYNENWSQIVYTCGHYNCNIDEDIAGLPVGVYHVKVQAWTAGWSQMVCNLIVDVEIIDEEVPNSDVCEVNVEVNGNTIAVNNLNQPITILDIYNESWSQVVYHCGHDDCDANEIITGLADGIYHIKIQSYTAGWAERVCDTIIDVEIGMTPAATCDVEIIGGNGFLTVNNLDEPLVSMFIFTGNYRNTIFRCDYGDCPTTKTIAGLKKGAYVAKVQSYTNNFGEEVCNFLQTVIVGKKNACFADETTHFFGTLSTGMYQAENAILSNGQVEQDSVVTFTADKSITLGSGFHATTGSSFKAMIKSCSSNTIIEPESVANSRTKTNTFLPDKFLKIAPNPFKNNTRIQYNLPHKTQQVSMYVYDMAGQIIQNPIRAQEQTQGLYTVDFQGNNLFSGMYYVALRIDGEVLIEKIVVMN